MCRSAIVIILLFISFAVFAEKINPVFITSMRVFTVIIDPGHGGKDTGAIGKSGLREKDVVLKSPDIPSILVETGFITNPTEEARLMNPFYQDKIAHAIAHGVQSYIRKYGNR